MSHLWEQALPQGDLSWQLLHSLQRARAAGQQLSESAMSDTEEHFKWMYRYRDIETPCEACRGFGTRMYGSTSTWRGGMGGASMMQDVCDECWGSGDINNQWTDLRKLRAEENARVAARAATLFSDRCGLGLSTLVPGIRELVLELEKFDRQRRKRANGFNVVASCLAKLLKELLPPETK